MPFTCSSGPREERLGVALSVLRYNLSCKAETRKENSARVSYETPPIVEFSPSTNPIRGSRTCMGNYDFSVFEGQSSFVSFFSVFQLEEFEQEKRSFLREAPHSRMSHYRKWATECAIETHRGLEHIQDRIMVGPFSSFTADGAVYPPDTSSITAEQAVTLWAQHFTHVGVSEALLSSQYIIAHVLGEKTLECVRRERLKEILTDKERERIWELCSKRLTRMPVQYVIEEWDFRDLTLEMRPPVFIPRPETEELVGLVLEDLKSMSSDLQKSDLRCLEVGCGSGAISLSLLHSLPQLRVFAVDQSQAAVCLTMKNANRLGLQDRIDVHHLDVIKDADVILSKCGSVDFLVSNPPYILSHEMKTLQTEILSSFEDHAALDGGLDGLNVVRPILTLASRLLTQQGRVYLEVSPSHPAVLQQLVQETLTPWNYLGTHADLSNRSRFCILQKK
ncbi:hypothetical protein DNTS_020798 [Danionella cerebrum]|uniref:peptide chain release factor N(5)-glutamine methyltransferase n=1 Tax=Danionella cerebrum TaxID=2873325 RepID=A0A553MPH3_9TELE|nr:hypothetical protein DNTS_020798 [Danionella translucida]